VEIRLPEGAVELRLLNALGETIEQKTLSAGNGHRTLRIDRADLPAGAYVVQLRTPGGTMHRSVIVE
jgi:hypothetical protein